MRSRNVFSLVVTVLALTLATWGYTQQSQSPTRPPGVSEDNWIPISDSAGIVVRAVRTGSMGTVAVPFDDPADPDQSPVVVGVPPTLYGTGVVMAVYQGEWVVFEELAIANPRFRHLK